VCVCVCVCVTGSLYVLLFSGEVIIIRYQHIAGCQSLYSYILRGWTAAPRRVVKQAHGVRVRRDGVGGVRRAAVCVRKGWCWRHTAGSVVGARRQTLGTANDGGSLIDSGAEGARAPAACFCKRVAEARGWWPCWARATTTIARVKTHNACSTAHCGSWATWNRHRRWLGVAEAIVDWEDVLC